MGHTITCANKRKLHVSECSDGIYLAIRTADVSEWALLTEEQAENLIKALQEAVCSEKH